MTNLTRIREIIKPIIEALLINLLFWQDIRTIIIIEINAKGIAKIISQEKTTSHIEQEVLMLTTDDLLADNNIEKIEIIKKYTKS